MCSYGEAYRKKNLSGGGGGGDAIVGGLCRANRHCLI